MKTCSKCGEIKTLDEFSPDRNRRSKSGIRSSCKACARAYAAARRADDPESARRRVAEWRAANPERDRESAARSRAKHPERRKTAWAKWYAENADRQREKARAAYDALTPDERAKLGRFRNSRYRTDRVEVTADELAELMRGASCVYCGAPAEHIDHVLPLSKGGRHHLSNIVPACAFCNLSKRSKLLTDWSADRVLRAANVDPKVAAEYERQRQPVTA